MTTGEDNQEGRQLMFTDSSFGMLTENVEVPKQGFFLSVLRGQSTQVGPR